MDEQKMGGKCECGTCASCVGMKCSPIHWSCCIVPILSVVFWVAGIVSLVVAWCAGKGPVLDRPDAFWYLNALALGVLAMGGRGKKFGSCRKGAHGCGHGACGSGCGGCKEGMCK